MVNQHILLGRLGRDPEARTTSTGTTVTSLSVATDRSVKRGDAWEPETTWHRVVVFGKTAENCARYLKKGQMVYIVGRISIRTWEDKDGAKRTSTETVADDVKFLSPRAEGTGSTTPGMPDPRESYGKSEPDDDIPF